MAVPKLKAEIRNESGRRNSNKLRVSGYTPGVIYSHGEETQTIRLETLELNKLFNRYGETGRIEIELEGETVSALIKEVQRDPVKASVLHADFQRLSADVPVRIRVPISIQGREAVEEATRGVVEQQLMEVELQCLPKYIPQYITVDVSSLDFGQNIVLSDLDIAKDENYEMFTELSEVIVSLTASSKVEEPEEETEVPIYESEKSILEEE